MIYTTGRVPWPLAVLLVALAHVGLGLLSRYLAVPPGYSATVWLPSGLAFFAVLTWGNRMLIAVILGELISAAILGIDHGTSLATFLVFAPAGALIYALQAWVGAVLARRTIALPSAFDDPRDILLMLVWGGPVAALCTALPGPWLMAAAEVDHLPSLIDIWNWWVGEAIGVTVMVPLLLVALGRPLEIWRLRRTVVAVPVVLGMLASLFAFSRVSRAEERRMTEQFEEQVLDVAARARTLIELYAEGLRSVDRLFASSNEVTRDEFARFVTPLLERHPGVDLIAWAPRVPAGGRDAFPALFVEPPARLAVVAGFDLASEPELAAALAGARDGGDAVASAQLRVFSISSMPSRHGLAIVVPVYGRGPPPTTVAGRRQQLRGYVLGVLSLDHLMQAMRGNLDPRHVEIALEDHGPRSARDRAHPERITAAVRALFTDAALLATASVEAAGRRWQLRAVATEEHKVLGREWRAWTVLSGGLLFTSLLGAFLLVGSGRSARIEALVDARTSELEDANLKLRGEITRRLRSEKAVARHAEELERSNVEKEVLLKEIHHRVKNNLQVISSLLNLQSRQITDPASQAAFRESQGRVRAMALFHEQIYRSRSLADIDLGDYIRNVATTLIQTYAVDARAIGLSVECDGVKAGIDLAISCGLIAHELIVNSIKYAFADGRPGTITVGVRSAAEGIEIEVSDDGVGLPPGFDLASADSFGLQLVVTLVEQLEGTITHESPPASSGGRPGARFLVQLSRPRVGRSTPAPLPVSGTPLPGISGDPG